MRYAILLLITLVTIGWCDAEISNASSKNSKNIGLKLNITIEKEKSCRADDSAYSEVLELTTRYTNEGSVPRTIFLGSDVATEVFVARTVEDLKSGRYETQNKADVFPSDGNRFLLGEDPKTERPRFLKPGHSVDGKNTTAVAVRKDESARIPGTIAAGKHLLQIGMLLRVAPDSGAKEEGHRKQGYHWISVLSDPVALTISDKPDLQDCTADSGNNIH